MTDRSSWVRDRLGLCLDGPWPEDLVGLALRHNPRRAHLLVSPVLGKHVPAPATIVLDHGARLGAAVRDQLAPTGRTLVLGYAETATALGHAVAAALAAPYLHTTRRPARGRQELLGFEEEHSHATTHRLLPDDPGLLEGLDTLVLVDDELSTGRTALNTLQAVRRQASLRRVVLAALVDVRTPEARDQCRREAAALGVELSSVALLSAALAVPARDPTGRSAVPPPAPEPADPALLAGCRTRGRLVEHLVAWPARLTGRHGWSAADETAARAAAAALARELPVPAVVLGTEELMYVPQLLATALGPGVLSASSTRSPVVVVDEPGYAVRRGLHTTSPYDPGLATHLYNLPPDADVVVLLEPDGLDPDPLLSALCRATTGRVDAVTLQPVVSGSYEPADVTFLLTDITGRLPLLAPPEREAAIQGGRHYSEMVPREYQPGPDYLALFHASLTDRAPQLAVWAGALTELVLAERGPDPVLVSLARAGTPVGILLRRYAALRHGVDLPHLSISIIRGRGLDPVALTHLLAGYPGRPLQFVDGWTGKGAIADQLTAALAAVAAAGGPRLDDRLAVLADPGRVTSLFGTRADVLVPSACLNSTVSGLLSRTVLSPDVLAPGDFHGAHRFDDLACQDLSRHFVDAVTACFETSYAAIDATVAELQATDRTPDRQGRRDVEAIAADFGLADLSLVKPGVGEASRVLLRRVPWQVLVHPQRSDELRHLAWLARDRGVPLVPYERMTYSACGLIRPLDRAD